MHCEHIENDLKRENPPRMCAGAETALVTTQICTTKTVSLPPRGMSTPQYCNSRGRGLVTSSRSIDPGIASVLQSKTCHSADVTLMSDNDATFSSRTSFGDRFAARLVVVERNELRCTTGVHFSQNGEEAHLECAIAKAPASKKKEEAEFSYFCIRP